MESEVPQASLFTWQHRFSPTYHQTYRQLSQEMSSPLEALRLNPEEVESDSCMRMWEHRLVLGARLMAASDCPKLVPRPSCWPTLRLGPWAGKRAGLPSADRA